MKRIFDVFFSCIGLVILLPLFMLIACWIKLDSPGPIFYKQVRVGRSEQPFRIYKFRTMVTNAEQMGGQITPSNDCRITHCGKFLRKYKLDEIPQLINVAKGEMSLVGPRPEVPHYVALYTEDQRKVLTVRPGITDLASIEFRNENELLAVASDPEHFYIYEIMPRKLELNQQYLHQSGLLFDAALILKTLNRILIG